MRFGGDQPYEFEPPPEPVPAGTYTPPRTPEWVTDIAKWRSLSRAERRALERHHRKAGRRAE